MSLIEVLVAFVILGMVMSVIMRINATSMRNHDVSKAYRDALRVAESRLASEGLDSTLVSINSSGEASPDIRWEFTRQAYSGWSEERLLGLPAEPVEERITVSWGSEPFDRELSFSRIKLLYGGR